MKSVGLHPAASSCPPGAPGLPGDRGTGGPSFPSRAHPTGCTAVAGTSSLSQMVHAPAQTCGWASGHNREMKRLLGPPWTWGLTAVTTQRGLWHPGGHWAFGSHQPQAWGTREGRQNGGNDSFEPPPDLVQWSQRHQGKMTLVEA